MPLLKDERVEALLPNVQKDPRARDADKAFVEKFNVCGLPPSALSVGLIGPVFFDGPPEPLLEEAERLRAADPSLWQLVYIPPVFDATGMEILSFDSFEAAEEMLNSLELGEIEEGGGIIFKNGVPKSSKLVLKYMLEEDFLSFLQDATQEPEKFELSESDEIKAIVDQLVERLEELTKLAPEIGRLKAEYEGKGKPEVVYGKPSMALVELSRLYPDLVTLGGCAKPKP
eukprot:symbB.v1.2.009508.t1/scaffold590.1/size183855/20